MPLPPSITVGPAASPRWFDVDPDRLPAYVDHLVNFGATAVELVVLPGDAPIEVARVHLLEAMWGEATRLFAEAGLLMSVHAPLTEAYRLDRLGEGGEGVDGWRRVCQLVAAVEQVQGATAPLVIHSISTDRDGSATTRAVAQLVDWLDHSGATGVITVELRAPMTPDDTRFDRSRDGLERFIERIGDERIGVCWDVANDWLAAQRLETSYTLPEPSFLRRVNHVHVHDAQTSLGLHAPLGEGAVPWRAARDLLAASDWGGRVTLEIRYRLASELGDPWAVLSDSLARFIDVD